MKILNFIYSPLPDIKHMYVPTKEEIIKYQKSKHSPEIKRFIINGSIKEIK